MSHKNPCKKYPVFAKEWQRGFEDGKREIEEERKSESERKIKQIKEKVAFQLKDINFDLSQISNVTYLSIDYLVGLFKTPRN